MTYAELGSVSEGTLKDDDLLDTFASHLELLTHDAIDMNECSGTAAQYNFGIVSDARECLKALEILEDVSPRVTAHTPLGQRGSATEEQDYQDQQAEAGNLIGELMQALEEFAPPLSYFGASEGDGAAFGFWPVDIDEAARELDVLKVEYVPEYIAVISDHGNVTLYAVTAKELWSIA